MFSLDRQIFNWIYALGHRATFWEGLAVFFAQYLPYLIVLAFLVLVYYQKGWRSGLYLFCEGTLAVILGRGIITTVIQHFYIEPRPFLFYNLTPLISESGSSFPSAHAAWFFALAMSVWFANRTWGWWFFVLAALMGIARIYTGVHWPMDIVGGALIGIASALIVHWLLGKSRRAIEVP